MALNLNKKTVVGVAVTPDRGLEVAQVDFMSRTILKYAKQPLVFDSMRGQIADIDKFKEVLQDMLFEMQIPKGSEIVMSLPAVRFDVTDFAAANNDEQISLDLEESLCRLPLFQDDEPALSFIKSPISTMQFTKVASTALSKVMLIEIAMQIKDLGYKLIGIDTSVGSTLNALIYNERVDVSPNTNWVLLLVEHNSCRILSMQGASYVDCSEERITIGEVLEEEENYSAVENVVAPILKNIPSKCLYIVSKTNVISAAKLARRLTYSAPIIHQEDNFYNAEPFLMPSNEEADVSNYIQVSLNVIGAAIYRDISEIVPLQFNLYNASLGDIYILEQPFSITFNNRQIVFSISNILKVALIVVAIIIGVVLAVLVPINANIAQKEKELKKIELDIALIQKYLKANKSVSTNAFDEGDEVRIGIAHNKAIFSYYSIVGTEIPKKLWLTSLDLDKGVSIEGQADNLESIYTFYRNIKDYDAKSDVKIQKLILASNAKVTPLSDEEVIESDSFITSANADYYEFRISDRSEPKVQPVEKGSSKKGDLPDLEPIE